MLPKKKGKILHGVRRRNVWGTSSQIIAMSRKPLRTLRGITCPHSRKPVRPAEKWLSSISIKSEPFLRGAEMFQVLIRDQENQMKSGCVCVRKTLGAKCLFSRVRTEPCLVRLRMRTPVMASGMMKAPRPPQRSQAAINQA